MLRRTTKLTSISLCRTMAYAVGSRKSSVVTGIRWANRLVPVSIGRIPVIVSAVMPNDPSPR